MAHFLSRTLQTTLCSLILVFAASSCKEENRLDIPVPSSDLEISVERLDQAWFDLSALTFRQQHPRWQEDYGELYSRYVEDVLNLGSVEDSNLFDEIRGFTTNEQIRQVQDSINKAFPDLEKVESELTNAWRYYAHYFPGRRIPDHLSFNGGFNTPAALTPNGVGIGLEMFLGTDCVFYEYLQIPVYLRGRMTPDHIAPTILKGWLETEFALEETTPTLVQKIIYQGKILYALDAMFPRHADGMKIFYSEEQIAWAKAHEAYVWAHFIDHELLFSTDATEIAKFTNDGPFTVDLVKESPSRMGYYIGWMIVRSHMDRQDTIDLTELMHTSADDILNQSNYKP